MSLAQNLRAFRNLRDLSQSELARASGISLKTIRNIEQGRHKHSPNHDTIERLASALEIPVSRLIEDPNARSSTTRLLDELRQFVSGLSPKLRRTIVRFSRALQKPLAPAESTE